MNREHWKPYWEESLAKPTELWQTSQDYDESEVTLGNTRNIRIHKATVFLKENLRAGCYCKETRMKKGGTEVDQK